MAYHEMQNVMIMGYRKSTQGHMAYLRMVSQWLERERDLREETVYCSPAWDCGKGSLV